MAIENITLPKLREIKSLHEKFYKEDFPFPNTRRVISTKVVSEGSRILGAAFISNLLESTLILDKSLSTKNRVLTLNSLMDEQKNLFQDSQITSFVSEEFARILIKHYDYQLCKGTAVVLNV